MRKSYRKNLSEIIRDQPYLFYAALERTRKRWKRQIFFFSPTNNAMLGQE